jgi:hypothetical protein
VETQRKSIESFTDLKHNYDEFHATVCKTNHDLEQRCNHQHAYLLKLETESKESGMQLKSTIDEAIDKITVIRREIEIKVKDCATLT